MLHQGVFTRRQLSRFDLALLCTEHVITERINTDDLRVLGVQLTREGLNAIEDVCWYIPRRSQICECLKIQIIRLQKLQSLYLSLASQSTNSVTPAPCMSLGNALQTPDPNTAASFPTSIILTRSFVPRLMKS
jgi:hypothetical protein